MKLIQSSPFLRRLSILVGGTAIGQLITIATLPLLTRLYSPESFSILALYTSFISIVGVVACLRLEIAIPLPRSDRLAAALLILAIVSVIGFTLLCGVVVVFFPRIFDGLAGSDIKGIAWLLPLGVFLIGMYNSLQYWSARKKRFGLIAKTRISQSVSGNSVKLAAGILMGGWTTGLVIGQLISQGSGFMGFVWSLIKNDLKIFKRIKLDYFKIVLRRYDKFPKYSTLEAFANTGGIQIPIILIAHYAVGGEAGHLIIAMQLLSAPMSLIGSSVSQVYLAEGSDRYHQGQLKRFTLYTIKSMAALAIVPLFIVGIVSPFLIPVLLGEGWQRTGILISWMVPWFFMQFITSPVSMLLHITDNQKIAFYLQVVGLLLRVGSVVLAAGFAANWIGELYAISGVVFYLIYLYVLLRVLAKVDMN